MNRDAATPEAADAAAADAAATDAAADEAVGDQASPNTSAMDSTIASSSIEVQEFDFQLLKMNVDSAINTLSDKLDCEFSSMKQLISSPLHPAVASPPSKMPAASPDYKQLYIESLLRHIDSLERTVQSQHEQIRSLQAVRNPLCTPSTSTVASPASVAAAIPAVAPVTPPIVPPVSAVREAPTAAPGSTSAKPSPLAKASNPPLAKASNPPAKKHSPAKKQLRAEVIGDSMVGGVWNWNRDDYSVKVHSYGGATTQDMVNMSEIALRRAPDVLIIHSGTNDFRQKISTKNELQRVIAKARASNADIAIGISAICHREDDKSLTRKVKDMNNQLKTFCSQQQVSFIDHDDFDHSCLAKGKLHPNSLGNKSLYMDFDRTISSFV